MNTPWAGIGIAIQKDASINTILKTGKLDWTVSKRALKSESGALVLEHCSIERDEDKYVFDIVGPQYQPMQNIDALNRFKAVCDEGYMTITTVGQLENGRSIFAIAQMRQEFQLDQDKIVGHVMMRHCHQYGRATSFYLMPVNQTNGSTFVQTIASPATRGRVMHYGGYVEDNSRGSIKEIFDAVKFTFSNYEASVKPLALHPCSREQITHYAMKLFYPKVSDWRVVKENAQRVVDTFATNKGVTWWDAFQTICHVIDFQMGKDRGFSLNSAWFGPRANIKMKAIRLVGEMTK